MSAVLGLVDAKVNDRAYMDPIGIRAVWVDGNLSFHPEDVRADFELLPAGPASMSPELTVAERMIELLSDDPMVSSPFWHHGAALALLGCGVWPQLGSAGR